MMRPTSPRQPAWMAARRRCPAITIGTQSAVAIDRATPRSVGRQGVSVTARASSLSCDNGCGVDLVGPGESQPRIADHVFEGPLSLPLGTLAQEGDLAVIPSKRPGVKAPLEQRWRVSLVFMAQIADVADSILA